VETRDPDRRSETTRKGLRSRVSMIELSNSRDPGVSMLMNIGSWYLLELVVISSFSAIQISTLSLVFSLRCFRGRLTSEMK
jgi:hypothetical protein